MRRNRLPGYINNHWNARNINHAIPHSCRNLGLRNDSYQSTFPAVNSLVANWDVFGSRSIENGKWFNQVTLPADGSQASAYDFYLGTDASIQTTDPAIVNGNSWNESALEFNNSNSTRLNFASGASTSFLDSFSSSSSDFTMEFVLSNFLQAPSGIWPILLENSRTSPNNGMSIFMRGNSSNIIETNIFADGAWVWGNYASAPPGNESGFIHFVLSLKHSNGYGLTSTNGVQVYTNNGLSAVSTNPASDLLVISNFGSLRTGSRVHYARMYNKALSLDQIALLYTAAKKRFTQIIG